MIHMGCDIPDINEYRYITFSIIMSDLYTAGTIYLYCGGGFGQ